MKQFFQTFIQTWLLPLILVLFFLLLVVLHAVWQLSFLRQTQIPIKFEPGLEIYVSHPAYLGRDDRFSKGEVMVQLVMEGITQTLAASTPPPATIPPSTGQSGTLPTRLIPEPPHLLLQCLQSPGAVPLYSFILRAENGIRFDEEISVSQVFTLAACPGRDVFTTTLVHSQVELDTSGSSQLFLVSLDRSFQQSFSVAAEENLWGWLWQVLDRFVQLIMSPSGILIPVAAAGVPLLQKSLADKAAAEQTRQKMAADRLRDRLKSGELVAGPDLNNFVEKWCEHLENPPVPGEDTELTERLIKIVENLFIETTEKFLDGDLILSKLQRLSSKATGKQQMDQMLIVIEALASKTPTSNKSLRFENPWFAGCYARATGELTEQTLDCVTESHQAQLFLQGVMKAAHYQFGIAVDRKMMWDALDKFADDSAKENFREVARYFQEAVVACVKQIPPYRNRDEKLLAAACVVILQSWERIGKLQDLRETTRGRFIESNHYVENYELPDYLKSIGDASHCLVAGNAGKIKTKKLQWAAKEIEQLQQSRWQLRLHLEHSNRHFTQPTKNFLTYYLPSVDLFRDSDIQSQVLCLAACIGNEIFAYLCETVGFVERSAGVRYVIANYLAQYGWKVASEENSIFQPSLLDSAGNIGQTYRHSEHAGTYWTIRREVAKIKGAELKVKSVGVESILDDIRQVLSALGFENLFIIIDNMDEPLQYRNQAEFIDLLSPLFLAVSRFTEQRIFFKVFAPHDLAKRLPGLKEQSSNNPLVLYEIAK